MLSQLGDISKKMNLSVMLVDGGGLQPLATAYAGGWLPRMHMLHATCVHITVMPIDMVLITVTSGLSSVGRGLFVGSSARSALHMWLYNNWSSPLWCRLPHCGGGGPAAAAADCV